MRNYTEHKDSTENMVLKKSKPQQAVAKCSAKESSNNKNTYTKTSNSSQQY